MASRPRGALDRPPRPGPGPRPRARATGRAVSGGRRPRRGDDADRAAEVADLPVAIEHVAMVAELVALDLDALIGRGGGGVPAGASRRGGGRQAGGCQPPGLAVCQNAQALRYVKMSKISRRLDRGPLGTGRDCDPDIAPAEHRIGPDGALSFGPRTGDA
jgi:hypothetical protein